VAYPLEDGGIYSGGEEGEGEGGEEAHSGGF